MHCFKIIIFVSHLQLVKIGDFEEAFQEELMHWIFDNEDRVWRYRGGSDGHETLTQYLGFLSHKRQNRRYVSLEEQSLKFFFIFGIGNIIRIRRG